MAKKATKTKKVAAPSNEVVFKDETYNLPPVTAGRKLSKRDRITIATLVCKMYQTGDYTLVQCLNVCGINSDNTWTVWRREIAEIAAMYKDAIESRDAQHREVVKLAARKAQLRNITGYIQTVTERIGEIVNQQTGEVRTTLIREKQIYIRPSQRAIEYALNNTDGENFTKNPEPYKAGNEEKAPSIEIKIIPSGNKPVTREQDIVDPTEQTDNGSDSQ